MKPEASNTSSFEDPQLMNSTQIETSDLNLRAPEVQEILGRPPRAILRVGISVVLAVVIALLIGSWFIKYPDILPAPVTVTTENLPAGVMAMTTGKIDTLFVGEQQTVCAGDLLAVIRNPARLEDVMAVKSMLEMSDSEIIETQNFASLQLGDLQSSYESWRKAREDYAIFLATDYHHRKIQAIERQIATQKRLLQRTRNQLHIGQRQSEVAENLFKMDSVLYSRNALSLSDYQQARGSRLQQEQSLESARMSLDNQEMSILQLEQSIFDLEQQRIEEEKSLTVALSAAQAQLTAQIRSWEQTFLIEAPCNGTATFTKYWQRNQNVNAGEVLVTVVPEGQTRIIGKILLPPQGAGKVEVGQTVNVKLDNYPYMEYGMLKVTIRSISLVPVQQSDGTPAYSLEVDFPDPLVTTYHKQLPFTQEMTGTAEIITKDLRLLERLWEPIRALFKR